MIEQTCHLLNQILCSGRSLASQCTVLHQYIVKLTAHNRGLVGCTCIGHMGMIKSFAVSKYKVLYSWWLSSTSSGGEFCSEFLCGSESFLVFLQHFIKQNGNGYGAPDTHLCLRNNGLDMGQKRSRECHLLALAGKVKLRCVGLYPCFCLATIWGENCMVE